MSDEAKKIDDGGQAFPCPRGGSESTPEGMIEHQFPGSGGMTLRDYFAAKAMQGLIAGITRFRTESGMEEIIVNRPNDASEIAYTYADAMLRARSTPTGGRDE